MNILETPISLFKPTLIEGKYGMGTQPENIPFGYAFGFNHQSELLAEIRVTEDKSKRAALKKGLWAVTPSSICKGGRKAEHVESHTGLLAVDIDNVKPIDQAVIKSHLVGIPSIAYVGLSASGTGLWCVLVIAYPDKHKQHFDAVNKMLADVGIKIDPSPSAVNSLRFVSYDSNHYFNSNAIPFELLHENKPEQPMSPQPLKSVSARIRTQDNPWHNFNANADFDIIHDILLNAGWQYHSTKGERVRYTRPHKDVRAGLSADYHTGRRTFYLFSSEAPAARYFIDKNGGSASDVLLHYAAGSDTKLAYRILKELNY